ncbi:MAG: hypothetical protein COW01_07420 [Bdellovibrionales bacterium CG12_big_fil_rev_8_21_14_0_65_38_15]|nr:MAG: hypothetical protein COW79_06585 [Bdellovibrionales bacterium CG22_combo_CG10-13_8_21_14_all_38_13]PIQ55460.1 MAG: hypothetical protein COW01_07420 [Bdellovibrionales bacterium CG12_big_fil_rev_8_21_14_0_65_38_15]PIR29201.1 MAG: hypothetical protein COV38_12155 [Bdellovibrionales bacterium CG11_big_fil_rev_8_21_14_0_20_38_13]
MTKDSTSGQELILETSLQTFFFDELTQVNQKSSRPLPRETVHYSSIVLDQYGESGKYFETVEGKVRDKVLGLKLLETCHMSRSKQVRALRDIGDTALFLCGFFSDSLNSKIIDTSYYQQVGCSAYRKLNHLVPEFYETPSFYEQLSKSFSGVTMLMNIVAEKMTKPDQFEGMLLFIGDRNIKAS